MSPQNPLCLNETHKLKEKYQETVDSLLKVKNENLKSVIDATESYASESLNPASREQSRMLRANTIDIALPSECVKLLKVLQI